MQGDARHHARSILEQLGQSPLKNDFCSYGTQDKILIGIGKTSSLELHNTDTFDAVWADINNFIEANSNDFIFGFIGFDPANQLGNKIKSYRQKIDLFVPEIVIECKPSGCCFLKGEADKNLFRHADFEPPRPNNRQQINISDLDLSDLSRQYEASASHFIEAIQAGILERATLARKIKSKRDFDLSETFISDYSRHSMARSFYFSNDQIAFAGHCPEVLAEGNTDSFATHKLSGTHAKDQRLPSDDLIKRFQDDPRIIAEHQSAIATIEESLSSIGAVQSSIFNVMELPTLLHGWSKFTTRPDKNTSIASCLRSVFPFGINPVRQGFELLARHENFSRGPYYGLTGCICPDGEFSFTQILRSAFVDHDHSYLLVGAAITRHSTPELEMNETCTKLSTIQVFERVNPAERAD